VPTSETENLRKKRKGGERRGSENKKLGRHVEQQCLDGMYHSIHKQRRKREAPGGKKDTSKDLRRPPDEAESGKNERFSQCLGGRKLKEN